LDAPVQFYEYWYFHIPNYVLAVLMYSLVGRFLLSLVFPPDSQNYIFRAFFRLTEPIVAAVRYVTPRAVPVLVTVLFAATWLFMLRFALLAGFAAAGLAPKITG
jgi:uncharacterized protein YggT (Ycf19 family)